MNRQSSSNRRISSLPLSLPALLMGLTLLAVTSLGGCAIVAVTAGAMVVNDEFQDRAQSAIVPTDAELAYKSSLATLSEMTTALIHRDDDVMVMQTRVDYGVVTVQVREISTGETEIRVLAEKALLYSSELSSIVLDRITNDLSTLRRNAGSQAIPQLARASVETQ